MHIPENSLMLLRLAAETGGSSKESL